MTYEPPTKQPVVPSTHDVQRVGDGDSSGSATSSKTSVNTHWFVDYNKIVGVTTKIPGRQSDDQLVVDELRIWPNAEDAPHILEGGNMAKSGAVDLGTVAVAKGAGKVSAAVRYAKKKQFDIKIDISPVPTRADAKAVADVKTRINEAVAKEIDHRGDYAAVAAKVANDFKDALPDRTIAISLRPMGAAKATTSYDAPAATYSAPKDTRFRVNVAPTQNQDRSVTWTESKGGEASKSHSDTAGVSSTNETQIEKNKKLYTSLLTSFANNATTSIQTIFKNIEGQMLSDKSNGQTEWSKVTTWKGGVGEAKDEKKEDGDKAKDGASADSVPEVIYKDVKAVGGFLVSKVGGLAKKIPIISTGLSILGDVWDAVSARGSVSRETAETDKTSNGKEISIGTTSAKEFTTLDNVISEWKQTLTQEIQNTVESKVATHLGLKTSAEHQAGGGDKTTASTSTSGTTITHEVGAPILEIENLE